VRISPPIQENLKLALNEKLIPWAANGQLRLLHAQPPFRLTPGIEFTSGIKPVLKEGKTQSTNPRVWVWPEVALNSSDEIYLGCVLDGKADIRIGVTESMAARDNRLRNGPGYYILHLTAKTVFLVPPGVPLSDGSQPHWEQESLPSAFSTILWINVRAQGLLLHSCRTQGATHFSSGASLVVDSQLQNIAEMLYEEMRNEMRYSAEIARSLFQALIMRAARSFAESAAAAQSGTFAASSSHLSSNGSHTGDDSQAAIVERACRYIRTYHQHPLTLERIAAHAFVSPTHLNRLFRGELQTSVMKYVVNQRIEAVQELLSQTDMPVREISKIVGFSHPSHLSQVFAREVGISPMQYRQQHRRSNRSK
jgi:AraC-like DNA-binding protein